MLCNESDLSEQFWLHVTVLEYFESLCDHTGLTLSPEWYKNTHLLNIKKRKLLFTRWSSVKLEYCIRHAYDLLYLCFIGMTNPHPPPPNQDAVVMAICSSIHQTLHLLLYTCKSAAEKHFRWPCSNIRGNQLLKLTSYTPQDISDQWNGMHCKRMWINNTRRTYHETELALFISSTPKVPLFMCLAVVWILNHTP